MNGPAWPRAIWLVILFLIAGNARCIAAQFAPASPATQKSASPAPTDQAAKPAPEIPAKLPLSLRERSWEILYGGLEIDNTERRVKAVTALGLMEGNAEAEKLTIAALKDQKTDVRAAAATALGSMHAVHAKTPLEVALDDNEPAVVLAAANSLMLLKDSNFAYDIYYGVLTGTVRTNNGAIKEQIKEQMKVLHDKKKIAQLGLEQGIGFIPYGGLGYGWLKPLLSPTICPCAPRRQKSWLSIPIPRLPRLSSPRHKIKIGSCAWPHWKPSRNAAIALWSPKSRPH